LPRSLEWQHGIGIVAGLMIARVHRVHRLHMLATHRKPDTLLAIVHLAERDGTAIDRRTATWLIDVKQLYDRLPEQDH